LAESPPRTRLARDVARRTYLDAARRLIFHGWRADAEALDAALADPSLEVPIIGPLQHLDAETVAAAVGKTRGAINNIWGSQQRFLLDVLQESLAEIDTGFSTDLLGTIDPTLLPRDLESAVKLLTELEVARAPRPGLDPDGDHYTLHWLLIVSTTMYAVWSETIRLPARDGWNAALRNLADELYKPVLALYGVRVRPPLTEYDLAMMVSNITTGAFVQHALDPEAVEEEFVLGGSSSTRYGLTVRAVISAYTEPITDSDPMAQDSETAPVSRS
jgi:hypothetical protein